ncbi:hypothetical protein EP331_07970 [bacterium]|nr:MAG: hypothetical protein EP331_07970 [bacterium]
MNLKHNNKRTPAGNSTYPKVAVQWFNLALCFYQSFCLVDSKATRPPPSQSREPLATQFSVNRAI